MLPEKQRTTNGRLSRFNNLFYPSIVEERRHNGRSAEQKALLAKEIFSEPDNIYMGGKITCLSRKHQNLSHFSTETDK